jgi:hypothetical protein
MLYPFLADVKFYCDIGKSPKLVAFDTSIDNFSSITDFDPFLFMKDNKKTYGWSMSIYEFDQTIPTLWDAVKGTVYRLIAVCHLANVPLGLIDRFHAAAFGIRSEGQCYGIHQRRWR